VRLTSVNGREPQSAIQPMRVDPAPILIGLKAAGNLSETRELSYLRLFLKIRGLFLIWIQPRK
jgi:hypothetical protein